MVVRELLPGVVGGYESLTRFLSTGLCVYNTTRRRAGSGYFSSSRICVNSSSSSASVLSSSLIFSQE